MRSKKKWNESKERKNRGLKMIVKRAKKENFLKAISRKFKERKEIRMRRQLKFLFNETFKFYLHRQSSKVREDEVDFPYFYYLDEQIRIAKDNAFGKLLLSVADERTVNKLYQKAIKEHKLQIKIV